jgi:hypothetical protein
VKGSLWAAQFRGRKIAVHLYNFFELRDHPDAEPHIQVLAREMKKEVDRAKAGFEVLRMTGRTWMTVGGRTFQILEEGEWHTPFVTPDDGLHGATKAAKTVSSARCARVSYYLPDTGKLSDYERDVATFDKWAGSRPIHASPLEHQATPLKDSVYSGNYRGWKQHRKEVELDWVA